MKLQPQRGCTREYCDLDTQKKFFSVSQIRAMMLNPYQGVPASTLEAARQRGTLLHTRFWKLLAARGGLCEHPAIIDQYAGQCQAMDAWAEQHQVLPVRLEEPGCNHLYGYAGTPDAQVRYGPKQILTLVDCKTGTPIRTEAAQMYAYDEMEGYQSEQLLDLYLREDGTYHEVRRSAKDKSLHWPAFLHALNILTWRANG